MNCFLMLSIRKQWASRSITGGVYIWVIHITSTLTNPTYYRHGLRNGEKRSSLFSMQQTSSSTCTTLWVISQIESADMETLTCLIQGLEKLNDITTTQYFRGTNRKHDYISQLMYKRIRLEHYQLNQLTGKSESERVLRKRIERIEFYEKTDLFDLNELCEAEDYDEPVLVEKGKNY